MVGELRPGAGDALLGGGVDLVGMPLDQASPLDALVSGPVCFHFLAFFPIIIRDIVALERGRVHRGRLSGFGHGLLTAMHRHRSST